MTDLETSFQQEKLDHQRETRFNRDIQLHEMELMQQISQIKNIMVCAVAQAMKAGSKPLANSSFALAGPRTVRRRTTGRRRNNFQG